jgi:carbon-monoxide dehydrogenase medium subunit
MVATFEYRAPTSVQEAVELLASNGDDAKVLAGGQSLVPLINLGLAHPDLLVDVNGIPGLDGIQEVNGSLAVGALVRHAAAEQSEALRRSCPLLARAIPLIGDRQVRNRGTIGGSLSHADPVAELPTVAVCLDAKMRIDGPSGSRDVPASEFFVTYLTTALEPADLLTAAWFPVLPTGTGVSFQELVRRKGDFAIVAAAAAVELAADGTVRKANLALAGVAQTPIRATPAEEALRGEKPSPELFRHAAAAAARANNLDPQSDVMASADYRRAMAEVYARRALAEAAEQATPGR